MIILLIVRPKTIHFVPDKKPAIFALVFSSTHLPSLVPNLNGCFRLLSTFHFSVALERFPFPFNQSESLGVKISDHVLAFEVLRE